MPGWNQGTDPEQSPQELLARLSTLKTDLGAMPARIASGEVEQDEVLAYAISGLGTLTEIVELLLRDYKSRRW